MTVDDMIDDILRREGGYVDHPADRGGPTNFGITHTTLASYDPKLKIERISESTARDVYKCLYYHKPKIHLLPDHIQPQIFDMAVNHGQRSAIRLLQKAINQNPSCKISVDGIIGGDTTHTSNFVRNEDIANIRIGYYADIVANDPSQVVFLKGWLKRAREFA